MTTLRANTKNNILQANDLLAERLGAQVRRQKLNFFHDWAAETKEAVDEALEEITDKFFKDMSHASKGIGRTSPLETLPGGVRSAAAGLPWEPLSAKWMKRKGNERFFHHTGKLKQEVKAMTWGEVFGTPEVDIDLKTRRRTIDVLKEGVQVAGTYASGKPMYRGAKGRFVAVSSALRQETIRKERLEIEVNFTPLVEAVNRRNALEVRMAEFSSNPEHFLYKLGGPAGKVRPLVTPFAAWYLDTKMPRALNSAIRKVKSRHGLI